MSSMEILSRLSDLCDDVFQVQMGAKKVLLLTGDLSDEFFSWRDCDSLSEENKWSILYTYPDAGTKNSIALDYAHRVTKVLEIIYGKVDALFEEIKEEKRRKQDAEARFHT